MTVKNVDYNIIGGNPLSIYPIALFYLNNTQIYPINFSYSRSIDNILSSFSITLDDLSLYNLCSPSEKNIITVKTGYKNNLTGAPVLTNLVSGYIDNRSLNITPDNLSINLKCLDKTKSLISPDSSKILVDVFLENYNQLVSYKDLDNKNYIISVKDLINFILKSTDYKVFFNGFDYPIYFYRKEDYPLNIIKDLVEFVGCYLRYNHLTNTIEILDRFRFNNIVYDFDYDDRFHILEFSEDQEVGNYVNAIRVQSSFPSKISNYEEELEKREDQKEEPKEEIEEKKVDYELKKDDDYHLVDILEGIEKAPQDPYVDVPPKKLIKKKFFNVWMGFSIDEKSIKVEGGTYNKETKKYEGATLIGYGGFTNSEDVLTSQEAVFKSLREPSYEIYTLSRMKYDPSRTEVTYKLLDEPNFKSTKQSSQLRITRSKLTKDLYNEPEEAFLSNTFMPGEGLVGFPQLYENNKDSFSSDLVSEDGIYVHTTIIGKVVDKITKEPLDSAIVEIDLKYKNNVWQFWKHKKRNTIIRFYIKSGEAEKLLDNNWENVTEQFSNIINKLTIPQFPKYTITKTGGGGESLEDEKGVFIFKNLPISSYTTKAKREGYSERNLDIEKVTPDLGVLSTTPGENVTKKYKILDTPYKIYIYAKKLDPFYMKSGLPGIVDNKENKEGEGQESDNNNYKEDVKLKDDKIEDVAIEIRDKKEIEKIGNIIYASPIIDSRIVNKEIAIRVGTVAILKERENNKKIRLLLPHNPYLKIGDLIRIKIQFMNNWLQGKILKVYSIDTTYTSGAEESILDTIVGIYE